MLIQNPKSKIEYPVRLTWVAPVSQGGYNREMDEITLSGLVFFGTHGVNPEETALGQRFGVDVTLRIDLDTPGRTDDLADTVSYSTIYKLIRVEMEGQPSKLIEHLASRLALAILR